MNLQENKRILLLIGNPGLGKTTVLLKAAESLKSKGFSVGGMLTREVRSGGKRVGFEIVDLESGKIGWLAHIDLTKGPAVGKYHVNLADLDSVGSSAIEKAVGVSDLIAIDEVGPMEMLSKRFSIAVQTALDSGKPVLGVIHFKSKRAFADYLVKEKDCKLLMVTIANRNELPRIISEETVQFLRQKGQAF